MFEIQKLQIGHMKIFKIKNCFINIKSNFSKIPQNSLQIKFFKKNLIKSPFFFFQIEGAFLG